jgi:hypothetical protein
MPRTRRRARAPTNACLTQKATEADPIGGLIGSQPGARLDTTLASPYRHRAGLKD